MPSEGFNIVLGDLSIASVALAYYAGREFHINYLKSGIAQHSNADRMMSQKFRGFYVPPITNYLARSFSVENRIRDHISKQITSTILCVSGRKLLGKTTVLERELLRPVQLPGREIDRSGVLLVSAAGGRRGPGSRSSACTRC